MHGRVKKDKSDALKEKEKKQKEAKLKVYRDKMTLILEKRNSDIKDSETLLHISDALAVCPEVYTLWNIRKEILEHMIEQKLIEDPIKVGEAELRLTETCLKMNPKSYVAWHHRCWIINHFPQLDVNKELKLCNNYLKLDARNFHCWHYRRFITSKLGLSAEDELSYTMEKITEDFSNYSSWHYRSKLLPLIHSDPAGVRPIKEEIQLQELDLVQNAAFTDPNDQSAWFYLRWLLGRLEPKLEVIIAFVTDKKLYIGFNRDASPSYGYIKVNGVEHGKWTTCNGNRVSTLWVSDMSTDLKEFSIDVSVHDTTTNILLSEQRHFLWSTQPQFDPDVSPKLKALLQEQLESCNQLLELEPECKWPLLTSVVSMKAIDTTSYRDEIVKRLKLLMKYDANRLSYYCDTLSKFLIEEALKSVDFTQSKISFSNLSLSSLYHSQYLSGAKELDLSCNKLQNSIKHLAYAVNLENLILDANDLTSLQSLPHLPRLISLSLAKNCLKSEDVLACLSRFPSLQRINLEHNTFIQNENSKHELINKIKSSMPSLDVII